MTFLVKICGLSTMATMEAALDAGVDMVGLVFYPRSPRHVSLAEAATLSGRTCGRAAVVALTVDADDAFLSDLMRDLKPDVIQLHGRETVARVAEVRDRFNVRTMKAVGVASPDDVETVRSFAPVSDYLLVDAKPPKDPSALPGGNGLTFDWRLVQGLDPGRPVLLSGGLTDATVAEAIHLTGLPGVDVSSGVESAPGVKDAEKIRAFVAAARAAGGPGVGVMRTGT